MISREEGRKEMIIRMFEYGDSVSKIARVAGIKEDRVEQILCNNGLTIKH